MKMTYHLILSVILSLMLFPFYSYDSIFVLVGGYLIDIDHYFRYIFLNKIFDIKEAYRYHKIQQRTPFPKLFIFHNIELLIILSILSFFSQIIMIISLGYVIHMLIDVFHGFKTKKLHHKRWSIIYYLFNQSSQ